MAYYFNMYALIALLVLSAATTEAARPWPPGGAPERRALGERTATAAHMQAWPPGAAPLLFPPHGAPERRVLGEQVYVGPSTTSTLVSKRAPALCWANASLGLHGHGFVGRCMAPS
jgi:hypothetical protein